jgi:hypothetical protein
MLMLITIVLMMFFVTCVFSMMFVIYCRTCKLLQVITNQVRHE